MAHHLFWAGDVPAATRLRGGPRGGLWLQARGRGPDRLPARFAHLDRLSGGGTLRPPVTGTGDRDRGRNHFHGQPVLDPPDGLRFHSQNRVRWLSTGEATGRDRG